MTIELWYKFLRLANLVWVPFRSVCDILTISFGGWGAWIGATIAQRLSYLIQRV